MHARPFQSGNQCTHDPSRARLSMNAMSFEGYPDPVLEAAAPSLSNFDENCPRFPDNHQALDFSLRTEETCMGTGTTKQTGRLGSSVLRSYEERKFSILETTQSRISPSILQYTKRNDLISQQARKSRKRKRKNFDGHLTGIKEVIQAHRLVYLSTQGLKVTKKKKKKKQGVTSLTLHKPSRFKQTVSSEKKRVPGRAIASSASVFQNSSLHPKPPTLNPQP